MVKQRDCSFDKGEATFIQVVEGALGNAEKGADVGRQTDAKCVDAGGRQEAWTKCSLDMESRNIIEEEELLRELSSRQRMLRG